jgi:hypothetical protein
LVGDPEAVEGTCGTGCERVICPCWGPLYEGVDVCVDEAWGCLDVGLVGRSRVTIGHELRCYWFVCVCVRV